MPLKGHRRDKVRERKGDTQAKEERDRRQTDRKRKTGGKTKSERQSHSVTQPAGCVSSHHPSACLFL